MERLKLVTPRDGCDVVQSYLIRIFKHISVFGLAVRLVCAKISRCTTTESEVPEIQYFRTVAPQTSATGAGISRAKAEILSTRAIAAMPPKYKPKAPQRGRKQAGDDAGKSAVDDSMSMTASLLDPAAPATAQTTSSASSSSIRPQPAVRLESLSRPGSSTAPGPTKAPLKFRPKSIIRRSKDERERVEREEQERIASRAVAGPSSTDVASGRGKGRGDFRGRMRGRGRGVSYFGDRFYGTTASGPFAAGRSVAVQKKYPIEGARQGYAGSLSSISSRSKAKVKSEKGATSTTDSPQVDQDGDVVLETRPMIKQDPYLSSSDDDEDAKEGKRVNIEHINLISDDEDDDPLSTEASGSGQRPIRINRTEHIERSKGISNETSLGPMNDARRSLRKMADGTVSTVLDEDPELKARRGRERAKDVELIKTERKWRGVYDDEEEVQVKPEPLDEDGDAMDLDPNPNLNKGKEHQTRQSISPTARAKHAMKLKKGKKRAPPFKPVILTEEDRKEWARHEEDLRSLVEELGSMKPEDPPKLDVDADGDTAVEAPSVHRDPKEGCLYLFQFPPVMPNLIPVAEPISPTITKTDPDAVREPGEDTATNPTTEAIAGVMVEGAVGGNHMGSTTDAVKAESTAKEPPPPHGRVGKLRVHKSGRVTMQWGGPEGPKLELMKGSHFSFLTDVVVTKAKGEGGFEENVAFGMGPVKEKFIAVPDWNDLLSR